MKNKLTGIISIAVCFLMVLSVMTACSGGKNNDDDISTLAPGESWSGSEDIYEPVNVTGVELSGIVSEALGDEAKDFNGDLSSLSDKQIEKVKEVAKENGYIVEENEKGETVVKKDSNVEAATVEDQKASEIYSKAGVTEGSTVNKEQYSKIQEAAKQEGATAVTNKKGEVEIISTTIIVNTTQKGDTTTKGTTATETFPSTAKDSNKTTTVPGTTKDGSRGTVPTYSVVPAETVAPKTTGIKISSGNTFGNGTQCFFSANAATSDGRVAVGNTMLSADGKRTDIVSGLIVKYNEAGKRQWYDILSGDEITKFDDAAVLADGSIIVVGETIAENIAPDSQYKCKGTVEGVMVKYSANGKRQWIKLFGGSEGDIINAVAATPDGGFVIGGDTESKDFDFKGVTSNTFNGFVAKMDAEGNKQWVKALGGSKSCAVKDVAVTSAGTIYAVIESLCKDGDFASMEGSQNGRKYTVVLKLSPAGAINWTRSFWDAGNVTLGHIVAGNDNGCVIAGSYTSGKSANNGSFSGIYHGGSAGTYDGMIVKLSATGATTWKLPLVGFESDYISDICAIKGGYVVTGYTTSTNRDFSISNSGDYDSFVAAVSEGGKLNVITGFGGTSADRAQSVCSSGSGATSVYVSGMTYSNDISFAGSEAPSDGSNASAFDYKFDIAQS